MNDYRDLLEVEILQLPGNEDLPLPTYQTEHAAAMDLHAAVTETLEIHPGQVVLVPCGFSLAVPIGYEAQVRPRSGLAAKHAILVVNSPGTIDSDYRGEVKVILQNNGDRAFILERGTRIAQMLICPVPKVVWKKVDTLPETQRGAGGFGHTGT
jgi:dUTP pyrophosphatase